jgi:site-specific recombinase XerD
MYEIEVLPPETAEETQNPFALAYANQARFELRAAWDEQRDKWLAAKHRKSAATYRAYADATNRFRTFTGLDWWLITADHVRAWQDAMLDAGLAAATVSQRLAAVSSFYSWVINEQKLGKDGVERSLFFDAHGRTRANPFRANNTERPRPAKTGVSRPISRAVIENLLPDINTGTLEGARDFALLKTFLLTGWRNDEVLKLRWGDLRPNDERPGEYVAAWTGKGQKSDIANVFPAACYHSIVAYLKRAGRYLPGTPAHIQPGDYIWQPIRDHGIANFPNTAGTTAPAAERHISPTQANNILRKHLRHALRKTGLTADEAAQRAATYHIHNLRHTFAHGLKRAKFDVLRISKLMHHSNIAITQRYLDELEEPIDDYSQALQTALGI